MRRPCRQFDWLDDDPLYLKRGQKYSEFLQSISDEEKAVILGAVRRGQLTGGNVFLDQIESPERRIELRGRGRPRKENR